MHPQLRTLQVGKGSFAEEPGGLNRYYRDLVAALADTGAVVHGAVVARGDVGATSGAVVEGVVSRDRPIVERWRRLRAAGKRFLARTDDGLVASHFALYAYPMLDLVRGRPFVVHFHGPWASECKIEGEHGIGVAVKHHIETRVYQAASRVVVLSRAFADVLTREYGVPADRIRFVPGAVDVERFDVRETRVEARARLGWPGDRPVVLAVRRLVHRMGLEDLVEAVPAIRRRVPDVLVLIAGTGPRAATLERRIAALGLRDHVRLLGFLPDHLLPLAYRAATVTVVPTMALEGFGLVVAESLAAGTPALVTPVGSLPEVVHDLSESLVLATTGPAAIADGVARALDGTTRLPDAQACMQFTRARYSWPLAAQRVRDVYTEALSL
ncbi:MAG TPA: glycosyltransferase family 4 protein [Gemmatirosa sp.]